MFSCLTLASYPQRQHDDIWSVLATTRDYVTEEQFIEHLYEYRVQSIGEHIRCFKRNSDSGWKNNQGNVSFAEMEVEPKHKIWVKACSAMLGGLDIFALDVLRKSADGEDDVVIEINPSACGLWWEHEEEDAVRIRDLILQSL